MRYIVVALAALLAGTAPAAAQDQIARDLERKARAGEQDGGFCARAGADLVKLTRPQAAEHLNRLLAGPDGQSASIIFAMADVPDGGSACAYLSFGPAKTRDGKKCRPVDIFICIVGQDCRAKLDGTTCEMRPGMWD